MFIYACRSGGFESYFMEDCFVWQISEQDYQLLFWLGLDRLGRPIQNRPPRKQKKVNGRIEPGLVGCRVCWFGLDWVKPDEFGWQK